MIEQIMQTEMEFNRGFSREINGAGYSIFYNTENPLSYDSNHALIYHIGEDIEDVLDVIEKEYGDRNIVPRIYSTYHPKEKELLLPLLKKRGYTLETEDMGVFIHNGQSMDEPSEGELELVTMNQIREDVRELMLKSDGGDWNWNKLTTLLSLPSEHFLVLQDSHGKALGLASVFMGSGLNRIDDVMIHPQARGKGWGRLLVQMLMIWLNHQSEKPTYLFASNPVAIHIYQRLGFEEVVSTGYSWEGALNPAN